MKGSCTNACARPELFILRSSPSVIEQKRKEKKKSDMAFRRGQMLFWKFSHSPLICLVARCEATELGFPSCTEDLKYHVLFPDFCSHARAALLAAT